MRLNRKRSLQIAVKQPAFDQALITDPQYKIAILTVRDLPQFVDPDI